MFFSLFSGFLMSSFNQQCVSYFYYYLFLFLFQLLFPIVNNGHWFGFAVNFEFKVFAFLDSLLDQNSSFHLATKNRLVREFCFSIHIVFVNLYSHFSQSEFCLNFPLKLFVVLFQIDNFIHLWEVIISEQHNFRDFGALYPDVPKQNPG